MTYIISLLISGDVKKDSRNNNVFKMHILKIASLIK